VEVFAAWLIQTFICVSAEKVSLCLQEVSGQPLSAIPVIKRKRSRERWCRHPTPDRMNNSVPPGWVILIQQLAEEVIEQQV
jgi:hypothetical protein